MLAHSSIVKLLGVVSRFHLHFIVSILVTQNKSRMLLHEAKILQMLAHSNLVKLLGMVSRFLLHFIVSILVTQEKKSRMLLPEAKKS